MTNFFLYNSVSVISYYIRNISSETVFQFLQRRGIEEVAAISKERADLLEELFYKLDQPLVNLGLACYGENIDILRLLYQSSDHEIRLAALGNKNTFQDNSTPYSSILREAEVEELLIFGNSDEQQSTLLNPYINSGLLLSLYCKSGIFKPLNEEKWRNLIFYTINNRRLHSFSVNYPSDSKYEDVIRAAWFLSETVQVNDDWAYVLMSLYENLQKFGDLFNDIEKVIARWQCPSLNTEHKDAYDTLRIYLADLVPIKQENLSIFLDSEDIAMRSSFFKRFEPKSTKELNKYIESDHEIFLINAICNDKIIKNKKFSNKIHEFCIKFDENTPFYQQLYEKKLRGTW